MPVNTMQRVFFLVVGLILTRTAIAEEPKTLQSYLHMGVGYSNLPLPGVLLPEDVERWARTIAASDEQRAFMLVRYDEFVKRHNELMGQLGPSVVTLSAEFAEKSKPDVSVDELERAAIALQSSIRRFRDFSERVENDYIDAIMPGLTDDQIDRLYLLRGEASRRQSRSFRHLSRWTNVDLRLLWEEMDRNSLEASDAKALETILDDYETRVTPVLRRMSNVYWTGAIEMSVMVARHSNGKIDSDELRNYYHRMWNSYGDATARMREITQQTLNMIGEALPGQGGVRVIAEAKSAAFPEVYPDSRSIEMLFVKILESDMVNDGDAKTVEDLRNTYLVEYRSICNELESFCINWGDKASRGTNGYQQQYLRGALQPLLQKREQINEKWTATLASAVGEELVRTSMPTPSPVAVRSGLQRRSTGAGELRPLKPQKGSAGETGMRGQTTDAAVPSRP